MRIVKFTVDGWLYWGYYCKDGDTKRFHCNVIRAHRKEKPVLYNIELEPIKTFWKSMQSCNVLIDLFRFFDAIFRAFRFIDIARRIVYVTGGIVILLRSWSQTRVTTMSVPVKQTNRYSLIHLSTFPGKTVSEGRAVNMMEGHSLVQYTV